MFPKIASNPFLMEVTSSQSHILQPQPINKTSQISIIDFLPHENPRLKEIASKIYFSGVGILNRTQQTWQQQKMDEILTVAKDRCYG